MAEADPRAKYRLLPPNVDSADYVTEIDAELAEVERGDRYDYDNGADPYLRIAGYLPPR